MFKSQSQTSCCSSMKKKFMLRQNKIEISLKEVLISDKFGAKSTFTNEMEIPILDCAVYKCVLKPCKGLKFFYFSGPNTLLQYKLNISFVNHIKIPFMVAHAAGAGVMLSFSFLSQCVFIFVSNAA